MLLSDWIAATAGDYRHARKHVDPDSEETPEDLENWFRLYDEYLERWGLGEKYAKILKVMKKKALLELKYVRTRDRMLLTLIAVEEERLRKLIKSSESQGMTTEDTLAILSQFFRFPIRAHEITVVEYQTYLKQYGRSNKAA